MNELPELYEESSDLQMDVMPGDGDRPQMEVGGGTRGPQPQLEEEGPARGAAGPARGPDFESEDEGEEFDAWEDDSGCPEEEHRSAAGCGVSTSGPGGSQQDASENIQSQRSSLDGGFQMHYEKTPFDPLAFVEELSSLRVVSRLTEELG